MCHRNAGNRDPGLQAFQDQPRLVSRIIFPATIRPDAYRLQLNTVSLISIHRIAPLLRA